MFMRINSTTNCQIVSLEKRRPKSFVFSTLLYCITALLFCTNIYAQTFPSASSCTSKDLELISATLPAPINDPCKCDGTRPLILGIRNKTGSTRTAFALWGTLKRYDAQGKQIGVGEKIFACAGPIKANSDNFLPATSGMTTITISCGQALEIVDLYLAWTSANNNENCDYLKTNSATINPKCGTLPSIRIETGVNAVVTPTGATCTTPGSIKVAPYGGASPYKVKIGSVERAVAANSSTTYNLAAGDYDVIITDSKNCSITLPGKVESSPKPIANAGADFTKTCIQNTDGKQIGEASATGFTYSWLPSTGLSAANVSTPFANPSSTTTYTVTKTNTSSGCSATDEVVVTVNKTAPAFTVCVVQPTLCSSSGSVTFNASGGSGFAYSINNGSSYETSNSFSNLGSGSVSGFSVKNSFGCVTTVSCADAVVSCPQSLTSTSQQSSVTDQEIELISDPKTNVIAAPNPFNDRIRFTLKSAVSGQGSLELYNTLGQKVKTVFRGYVNANQKQNIEYAVPGSQRSNLIYVFRVGNEQTTGKLIGLK